MRQLLTDLISISHWDVSSVTTMDRMFYYTRNLTDSSAINNWDITNVSNFDYIFHGSLSHPEFKQVEGTWNEYKTFIPNS